MRNLACYLEMSDESENHKRNQFFRSLVPNAVVLRQPDGFVCGICGMLHKSREQAHKCLGRCVRAREQEGVITCAPLGEVFTCPHCSKRFARREDAVDCHGRRRRLSKIYFAKVPKRGVLHWDDSIFNGLKEVDTHGVGRLFGHRLRLEAAFVISRTHDFSGARPPAHHTVVALGPTASERVAHPAAPEPVRGQSAVDEPLDHDEDVPGAPRVPEVFSPAVRVEIPVEDRAEPPEEDTSALEPEPYSDVGPHRELGMKPFKRHDARYVCSACGKNYFTRSEVEDCFFSHPERRV